VLLERGLRIRRGLIAPQLVDQAIARHRLAQVQEQNREDAPLLRPTEREPLLAVVDLERPEQAVVEQACQSRKVPPLSAR
jgi:hypothetical protein